MGKPYKYCLRPGYGSDKLLLEFNLDSSDTEFNKDIMSTLMNINPKVDNVEDRWMNDEVVLHFSSDEGPFLLSRDIWDFAFITAEQNQLIIKRVDEIFSRSSLFEKEEVDFEKYKIPGT